MVNASLAGIIAAICATAGAFLGTLATVLYNHHIDVRKRRREERDVVGRYRDALLHASEELHTPLRYLCEGRVPDKIDNTDLNSKNAEDSYEYCYLIYLIGRLFCWTYIIQNDIRNVHYLPTEQDHTIMNILYSISLTLANGENTAPFRVFKGFQAAIGEKMSVANGGQISCMGYAAFWSQWTLSASQPPPSDKDVPFRVWFSQVEDGIKDLKAGMGVRYQEEEISRIMKFQHRVVDLSEALDPHNQRIHHHERTRWRSDEDERSSVPVPSRTARLRRLFRGYWRRFTDIRQAMDSQRSYMREVDTRRGVGTRTFVRNLGEEEQDDKSVNTQELPEERPGSNQSNPQPTSAITVASSNMQQEEKKEGEKEEGGTAGRGEGGREQSRSREIE